jgi:hypothetical protein
MNTTQQPKSANFNFLGKRYPDLERIGALCERYFSDDPIVALITLRQFGELLAQMVAARSGLLTDPSEQASPSEARPRQVQRATDRRLRRPWGAAAAGSVMVGSQSQQRLQLRWVEVQMRLQWRWGAVKVLPTPLVLLVPLPPVRSQQQ